MPPYERLKQSKFIKKKACPGWQNYKGGPIIEFGVSDGPGWINEMTKAEISDVL